MTMTPKTAMVTNIIGHCSFDYLTMPLHEQDLFHNLGNR